MANCIDCDCFVMDSSTAFNHVVGVSYICFRTGQIKTKFLGKKHSDEPMEFEQTKGCFIFTTKRETDMPKTLEGQKVLQDWKDHNILEMNNL